MLSKFFAWLESGAYQAVMRGVNRAVQEVTGGEVEVLALEPPEKPKAKRTRK